MVVNSSKNYSLKLIYLSFIFSIIGLYLSNTFIGLAHIFLILSFLFFFKEGHFDFKELINLPILKFFIGFLFFLSLSLFMNWSSLDQPWKLFFKLKYLMIGLISIPLYVHFFKGTK